MATNKATKLNPSVKPSVTTTTPTTTITPSNIASTNPKLTFKSVDFATAISKGLGAMGISYQVNDQQIKQLN